MKLAKSSTSPKRFATMHGPNPKKQFLSLRMGCGASRAGRSDGAVIAQPAGKRALLIIDVQYDFLPPSGSLAVTDGNTSLFVFCFVSRL